MHQLCSTLRSLGCEAVMVYISVRESIAKGCLHSLPPTVNVKEAYNNYDIKHEELVMPSGLDLLIFPEILVSHATSNFNCQVAIWWLSVDIALLFNPLLIRKDINQPIFENNNLIHFYQSEYAHRYLIENSARMIVPLYDYTSPSQVEILSNDSAVKSYDIAIFPSKGADLAAEFLKLEPDLRFVKIENMSKKQVYQTLADTYIYIDFGNQPGKDRVPREASISGCLIFLHRKGSAGYYEDSPLDDFFLFTGEDITSGNLERRIKLALENISSMIPLQQYYRNKILNERKEFELQCINFFTVSQPSL